MDVCSYSDSDNPYFLDHFKHWPEAKTLIQIARVIFWNLWQMDGLKYVVPISCKTTIIVEHSFFGIVRHVPQSLCE